MQIDREIFKGFTVFLSRKKKPQQEFDRKKDCGRFQTGSVPSVPSICSAGLAACAPVWQLMSPGLACCSRGRLEQSAAGVMGMAIGSSAPTRPGMENVICDTAAWE